jgi:hypothetical protein
MLNMGHAFLHQQQGGVLTWQLLRQLPLVTLRRMSVRVTRHGLPA